MHYDVKVIAKEQQKTSTWSGGTTTQLAIYPEDGDYGSRNFIWRLSSATVEAEEHQGHYKKILGKFDQDSFSGGWTTKSIGQATDFNLMMKEGCQGKLEAVILEKDEVRTIAFESKEGFANSVQALYSVKGPIIIEFTDKEFYKLQQGDILLIRCKNDLISKNYIIKNIAGNDAEFIIANIYHQ